MRKCEKCGAKMERFRAMNKREWIDECPKCNNTIFSAEAERGLKRATRDIREGRTFIFCCGLKRGKCKVSGQKPAVCYDCTTEQAKNWYKIGKADGRRRVLSRQKKGGA